MKFGLERYTLDRFLRAVIDRYASRPALAFIGEKPFTYAELGGHVEELKNMLYLNGIRKGDHVVILGASSPQWAVAFLAVTTSGAIAVPILDAFPESDIDHIIWHSEATAVFISRSLYESLQLTSLEKMPLVICLDNNEIYSSDPLNPAVLRRRFNELPDKIKKSFDKTASQETIVDIDEDDCAEILYTSGTTGHSKGVVLTHGNLVSNLFEGPDLLKVIRPDSVVLSILPMAHAFGSTSAFLSIIYCGASIYYLDKPPSPKVLLNAMQEVKPTIMGAVPLVFEKIFHKQVAPLIAKHSSLRLLHSKAFTKKLLYALIGRKIKKLLGGRLECVIIGGAAFSPEVEIFMRDGHIPYCCGYGLSECSPLVTFSSMEKQKMGSPGHAITDVSLKIADPEPETGIGEICVKGPNVMKGYYRDEEATSRSFTEDGWFITGDRGYLDEDGFLFITGRSKNVIVVSSGENIYPEAIEAKLIESIYVEEALVHMMDGRLVARVFPNYTYLESIGGGARDEADISTDLSQILEDVRVEVNKQLPSHSRIARIIEQPSPFMKTPTNKIKRAEYVPGY